MPNPTGRWLSATPSSTASRWISCTMIWLPCLSKPSPKPSPPSTPSTTTWPRWKPAPPRSIHVMVEKPLAVSLEHARRMAALANKHGIHLLTNYETTWYGSNHAVYNLVQDSVLGELRKVVVHDGHSGPKEIGVGPEFLEWLTDPKLNGGGALMDFGCYGANLITLAHAGRAPHGGDGRHPADQAGNVSEGGRRSHDHPHLSPRAGASFRRRGNWPVSRKDMEVYGATGYAPRPERHRPARATVVRQGRCHAAGRSTFGSLR